MKLKKRTLKLIIAFSIGLPLIFFIFKKCSFDEKSRDRLLFTSRICDDVFVENYIVSGQGALGTDLASDWLTDKASYRIYIGTFDQADGGYWFQCRSDSVYVRQLLDESRGSFKKDSLVHTFKIADLKKMQNFNDD